MARVWPSRIGAGIWKRVGRGDHEGRGEFANALVGTSDLVGPIRERRPGGGGVVARVWCAVLSDGVARLDGRIEERL